MLPRVSPLGPPSPSHRITVLSADPKVAATRLVHPDPRLVPCTGALTSALTSAPARVPCLPPSILQSRRFGQRILVTAGLSDATVCSALSPNARRCAVGCGPISLKIRNAISYSLSSSILCGLDVRQMQTSDWLLDVRMTDDVALPHSR